MLLLDTCALLWLASDTRKLSDEARRRIRGARGSIFVSAISAFEVGTKQRKGSLVLPVDPAEWYTDVLAHHGLIELPVTGAIAVASTQLPPHHADPCDRILIATAQAEDLFLVTPDPLIRAYADVRCLW